MNDDGKSLLSSILIKKNVITEEEINYLMDVIGTFDVQDTMVLTDDRTEVFDKKYRNAKHVMIDEKTKNYLYTIYRRLIKEVIKPHYLFTIVSSEEPQVLRYDVGGHYEPHCDSEYYWKSPDGYVWRKAFNRDLSSMIYLNDDFEGGDFYFPDLELTIKPEPGMFLSFPSNHKYIHGVTPVTKGVRYGIANWMSISGSPKKEHEDEHFARKYGLGA